MLEIVLPICGTIIVTAMSFYFPKKAQIDSDQRQRKVEHYKELLSAISDLAVDGMDKRRANERLSLAYNTIALVGAQDVVTALMAFHDEVKFSNPDRTPEGHDRLLKDLILAIRRDLKVSPKDDPRTFAFHLIGSAPPGEKL